MRMSWVVVGLSLLLPIVSSFITYGIVSMYPNNAIALDTTQASLLLLALMKMLLLGATGVFPIDLDLIFEQVLGTGTYEDEEKDIPEGGNVQDNGVEPAASEEGAAEGEGRRTKRKAGSNALKLVNNMLFKPPDVSHTPCIRRFLCEIETVIRTSDDFEEKPSENDEDRHLEEEVDVESPDPQLELYTEAVRALYGYDSPSAPDSSPATEKALALMQALTGKSCEQAYKLCSGRYSAPMVFGKIFNELKIRLRDEL